MSRKFDRCSYHRVVADVPYIAFDRGYKMGCHTTLALCARSIPFTTQLVSNKQLATAATNSYADFKKEQEEDIR